MLEASRRQYRNSVQQRPENAPRTTARRRILAVLRYININQTSPRPRTIEEYQLYLCPTTNKWKSRIVDDNQQS